MKKLLVVGLVIALVLGAFVFVSVQNKGEDMMTDQVPEKEMISEEEMSMDHDMEEEMKEETTMMNSGQAAPDFTVVNSAGDQLSLSELSGDKVYVKFWASWCSICLAGLDDLDALSSESEEFRVITIVSPDRNGEQDKASFTEWFEGLGYDHIEVYFDETGEALNAYGIRAFPTSAYIGSDGVLVKVQPGHVSNDKIEAFFESVY